MNCHEMLSHFDAKAFQIQKSGASVTKYPFGTPPYRCAAGFARDGGLSNFRINTKAVRVVRRTRTAFCFQQKHNNDTMDAWLHLTSISVHAAGRR
jgi:hypothetical protein